MNARPLLLLLPLLSPAWVPAAPTMPEAPGSHESGRTLPGARPTSVLPDTAAGTEVPGTSDAVQRLTGAAQKAEGKLRLSGPGIVIHGSPDVPARQARSAQEPRTDAPPALTSPPKALPPRAAVGAQPMPFGLQAATPAQAGPQGAPPASPAVAALPQDRSAPQVAGPSVAGAWLPQGVSAQPLPGGSAQDLAGNGPRAREPSRLADGVRQFSAALRQHRAEVAIALAGVLLLTWALSRYWRRQRR